MSLVTHVLWRFRRKISVKNTSRGELETNEEDWLKTSFGTDFRLLIPKKCWLKTSLSWCFEEWIFWKDLLCWQWSNPVCPRLQLQGSAEDFRFVTLWDGPVPGFRWANTLRKSWQSCWAECQAALLRKSNQAEPNITSVAEMKLTIDLIVS